MLKGFRMVDGGVIVYENQQATAWVECENPVNLEEWQ